MDEDWFNSAKEKGHVLKLDEDGDIDSFALDYGYHNGPACIRCGMSWCYHCTSADSIEPCISDEELQKKKEVEKNREELRKSAAKKLTKEECIAVGLEYEY